MLRKDGSEVFVGISAKMLVDRSGNFIGVEGTVRDITERNNFEDALQESELKFRSIFENAPLGLLLFDEKGRIIICNNLFTQILGSSHEKLSGLDMTKLPDKELVLALQTSLSGRSGKYEGIYRSVTGNKETSVKVMFEPIIGSDGLPHGGVGIVEDITESQHMIDALRNSEEKFRVLTENSSDIIWHLDNNFMVTYISPAMNAYEGFQRKR